MIADLFKEIHGNFDLKSLLPLTEVLRRREEFQNVTLPSQSEWEKIIAHLACDEKDIIYNPNGTYFPFFFYKEFCLIELHALDLNILMFTQAKERIEKNVEYMESLLKEGDFTRLFNSMDKRLLISSYVALFDQIPDEDKYQIFRDLYVRSEYGFGMFEPSFLEKVFAFKALSEEHCREWMEWEKIAGKRKVRVYRGSTDQSSPLETAYSWTLNKKVAKHFASKFDSLGVIYQAKINAADVLDYLNDRNEKEVLIHPSKITKTKKIQLK